MLELLYLSINALVFPIWLGMILFPNSNLTKKVMMSYLIFVPFVLIYLILIVVGASQILPQMRGFDLESLAKALGTQAGTATIWAHIVIMDAVAGRWIYLDSMKKKKFSKILRAGILFLTMMAAPIGFLTYLYSKEKYEITT